MRTGTLLDSERKSLKKLTKFQFPNYFKKIGFTLAIISFTVIILNKFAIDNAVIKSIAKYGMLVGLLLVSVSREKIEDELVIRLRMESFTFAFIAGVVYALLIPMIDYTVDFLIKAEAIFKDTGDFQILWMLLVCQICYFELLKKVR